MIRFIMYNKLTDELAVCGLNAVRTLGDVHPERINRLFVRQDRFPLFTGVCKNLAERKRPYKICEDEELERICKTAHHQGIVAMIYEPAVEDAAPEDLDTWAAEGKTGLLLCDVGNDHNLGAIVRSAAFFDASPIILTEPNPPDLSGRQGAANEDSPPDREKIRFLTTSAYRVAEGGMEYVEFRRIRRPAAFLRSASEQLVVIGTDPRARIRIRDLPRLIDQHIPRRASKSGRPQGGSQDGPQSGKPGVVLVVGNEETGLPIEVKDQCSFLARIPGIGNIENLNISQTAALFLQELYER
ncbi:MAG: RNA methyltransferase [Spirochaetaceae bacterium]|jgi:TrmH RNA methyltransferase|nr:RNA methyltransferase [Spirochaetaceae bacterium]